MVDCLIVVKNSAGNELVLIIMFQILPQNKYLANGGFTSFKTTLKRSHQCFCINFQ